MKGIVSLLISLLIIADSYIIESHKHVKPHNDCAVCVFSIFKKYISIESFSLGDRSFPVIFVTLLSEQLTKPLTVPSNPPPRGPPLY